MCGNHAGLLESMASDIMVAILNFGDNQRLKKQQDLFPKKKNGCWTNSEISGKKIVIANNPRKNVSFICFSIVDMI